MNFEKEHLKGSNILLQNIYYSELRSDVHLRLHVQNYSKLKSKVIYYASFDGYGYKWTYKLVIVNGTLFTFVHTTTHVERYAFYIYKENVGYQINNYSKRYENLILSEFCNKAIMNPKNGYLHLGNLNIKFKFEMEQPLKHSYFTGYGTMESVKDGVELRENLKNMFLTAHSADLKILVQDKVTFWVHKAILAISSKAFADSFQMNQPPCNKISCIFIDVKPRIFHIVLFYIYSGELDYPDEDDIFLVYKIADMLQIDSLQKKCMNYFEDKFSPSNILDIIDEARKLDLVELKNAAIEYIRYNSYDLSDPPQSQEITKDAQ